MSRIDATRPFHPMRIAVLTVSDTRALADDRSGDTLVGRIEGAGHVLADLVAAKGDAWELYDLKTDRAEQNNLAAKMPEKVKELADLWQKQTDETTALAKLTLNDQPKGKAKKKAK